MAAPQKLDIHWAIVQVRISHDQRPCVILESGPGDSVLVAPLSSQMDMYDPAQHFLLDSNDPDFAATGLKKTGFVIGANLRDMKTADLGRFIGRLDGKLAARFVAWIG